MGAQAGAGRALVPVSTSEETGDADQPSTRMGEIRLTNIALRVLAATTATTNKNTTTNTGGQLHPKIASPSIS